MSIKDQATQTDKCDGNNLLLKHQKLQNDRLQARMLDGHKKFLQAYQHTQCFFIYYHHLVFIPSKLLSSEDEFYLSTVKTELADYGFGNKNGNFSWADG